MDPWGLGAPGEKPLGPGQSRAQSQPDQTSLRRLGGRAGRRGPQVRAAKAAEAAQGRPTAQAHAHRTQGLPRSPGARLGPPSGGPLLLPLVIGLTPPSVPRSLPKSSQADRRDAGSQSPPGTGEAGTSARDPRCPAARQQEAAGPRGAQISGSSGSLSGWFSRRTFPHSDLPSSGTRA